jgi:alpha-glucosidase
MTLKPLRWRPGREIVYQIFPDRWKNARPEEKPAAGSWSRRGRPFTYSDNPDEVTKSGQEQHTFYGGDLEGVRRSIPYLESLGVTAVYLTPIFAARSTHRYDAVDYLSIDPILGTRADFEALSHSLREHGMRLVLDGVLNHTSDEHPWHDEFESRREHYIMKSDEETMTWLNRGSLPKLDTQNPAVAEKLLAVLDAWPETDMWRLDAAHLLPQAFLRDVRKRVAPRPVLLEDWTVAPHYFKRGLADGLTNFPCRESLRTFFIEDCSAETLLERLALWIKLYPARNLGHSWNFLDNHDTDRFLTNVGRERFRRAMVLLMTLPGCPLLYHGMEVGLEGKNPHESRRPMPWDESQWDHELLDFTRSLIRMRGNHRVLSNGKFRALAADNRSRTIVFERTGPKARATIALNDGYHAHTVEAGDFSAKLGPGEWVVEIEDKGSPKVTYNSARKP